jgi:hypothetical protein
MANQLDLTGKSTKFRDIKEIMNVPSMKVKLQSFIDEALKCKQAIQFQQDTLKQIRENAQDELAIKPALFNQYLAMVFNNDYVQRKDKLEEVIDLIDAVMRDSNIQMLPGEDD